MTPRGSASRACAQATRAKRGPPACAVPTSILNRGSRGSPTRAIRHFRVGSAHRLKRRGDLANLALVQRITAGSNTAGDNEQGHGANPGFHAPGRFTAAHYKSV